GVVFAKTFCWANSANLVAVDTLAVVARQQPNSPGPILVISDAQRDEVFAVEFQWSADTQHSLVNTAELRIRPVSELSALLKNTADRATLLTGPGLLKFRDRFPNNITFGSEETCCPTAVSVAELGHIQAAQQQFADIVTLEPVYVRRSYAEENSARPSAAEKQPSRST
ncbi:MAG: hypothetical protein KDA89_19380, partial [Planctomycetaceae bacterium]|nr:hypothetical protein [Planctomycetaceae bacterium]